MGILGYVTGALLLILAIVFDGIVRLNEHERAEDDRMAALADSEPRKSIDIEV